MTTLKLIRGLLQGFLCEFLVMLREEGTRLTECLFAGILMLWGAYLLTPGAWIRTDALLRAYQVFGPEMVWAGAMLAVGIVLFVGTVRNARQLRRNALFCSAMVWMALWSVYWLAGRASVGLFILPFYAVVSALLFLHPRFRHSVAEEASDGESDRNSGVGDGVRDGDRRDYQRDGRMVSAAKQAR